MRDLWLYCRVVCYAESGANAVYSIHYYFLKSHYDLQHISYFSIRCHYLLICTGSFWSFIHYQNQELYFKLDQIILIFASECSLILIWMKCICQWLRWHHQLTNPASLISPLFSSISTNPTYAYGPPEP